MKKLNLTNIVLGIIAAEVVYQTLHACADRVAALETPDPPAVPAKRRKSHGPFLIGEALNHVFSLLRRSIFGPPMDPAPDSRALGNRNRGQQTADPAGEEKEEIPLKGSMQGIAEKMKDPAWAGALAANDGNIALADAGRAVPMPNSAQFVERLDRNPFVGQGMKDHSRDKV